VRPARFERATPGRHIQVTFVAGDEFTVIDANCTDSDGCTVEVPAAELGDICYNVYAVGLGGPCSGGWS